MIERQIKAYACYNLDKDTRYNSTSGGLFLAICKEIIDRGGYVVGVEFDTNFNPRHAITKEYQGCLNFSGSKYPQSDTGYIYKDVKTLLDKDEMVLFSGTPCQVAGLKSFLKKDYSKLFCVDIICMGVASPKIWQSYLNHVFSNDDVDYVRFKDKKHGWTKYSINIRSKTKELHELGGRNIFMNSYVLGHQMRESCYECQFKGKNRFSDITIADCWGVEKIIPEWDRHDGISVALINSDQGNFLFKIAQANLEYKEIPYEKAIKENPYYSMGKELPPFNKFFWWAYNELGFLFYWIYDASSFHYRAIRKIWSLIIKK